MGEFDSGRKNPRFKIQIESQLRSKDQWENCHIIDINLEGAGINVDGQFEKQENIEIRLIDQENEVIISAEVVYHVHCRLGILFKKMTPLELNFIKNIINKYSKRFYI